MSRNLLVDDQGLAYVPRVEGDRASLVAYDSTLRELSAQPLSHYLMSDVVPSENHGIVGLVRLADGALAFTTHSGRLFELRPRAGSPAELVDHGWFHPEAEAYAPGLFTFSGHHLIAGIARRKRARNFEWVLRDLKFDATAAFELPLQTYRNLLLYGSQVRDDDGRFYVGGWTADANGGQRPILLQLSVN